MNYINLVLAVAFLFAAVSASPVKDSKHQEHHHGKNETHGHLNATTPAPGANGTTLAPPLNATTLAPELNATTLAPGLNATTLEPSLNGTTLEPSLNATTPSPDLNGTTLAPSTTPASIKRVKRDCKSKDLTKIESKLSLILEQEFEKLLNGSADLSNVSSSGKHLMKGSTEVPIMTNGHQGGLDGAPGKPGLPDSMDSMHDMEGAGAPGKPGKPDSMDSMHDMEGAGAPGAPGDSDITAQNVAAKANKHNGSAVAQAIAKRAATVAQNVSADAHNAVSNAEIHKGAFNNVQTVGSSGNQTGIANALIENQNGSGLNMQDVIASGSNAAASASINNPGEKNLQSSIALGTDSAIASSNIAHPVVGSPTKSAPKRAACLPFKMDENVREYIHHMVKKAIKDLKKDLDA